MNASPCKDCCNRSIGCHGNCKLYIDWTDENNKIKNNRKQWYAKRYPYDEKSLKSQHFSKRTLWG